MNCNLNYKFLIFIDDITLDNSQNEFKLFKSILDGSLISDSQNVKFYVTSNLRHLSNKDSTEENIDEITKKENHSNIVSLSDRFGVRLGFFENNKENILSSNWDNSDDLIAEEYINGKESYRYRNY